jgi:hypothetical protein
MFVMVIAAAIGFLMMAVTKSPVRTETAQE